VDVNEELDPWNGTWASREPMPTRRDEAAIVAVGDGLHVIGGTVDCSGGYSYGPCQLTTHEVYTVSLDYQWDFGDGADASGMSVEHAYAAPGVYTVTLTVTDLAGGVGTDTLTVTIVDEPPVADAGGAYEGVEGVSVTLDASASYDPQGDPLTYRWDFDSDGVWDTSWSPDPTAVHTWGDDFDGAATVEVSDGTGTAQAVAAVHIENVPPSLDADVIARATGDLTLRVAGEKFHDVVLTLYEDGAETAVASVYRVPGNPDEQAATIEDVTIDLLSGTWSAIVEYTPLDDAINGQVWGADPAWLIFTLPTGEEGRLHHTFNVRHEETWVWEVDDLRAILVGVPITFEATASDPGSDDLTFAWSWDDGTPDAVTTYYNDGVGPDPYPSPEVNPMAVTDVAAHAFASAGTFTVVLTVEDDDDGLAIADVTFSL
jgi:PKD repeat protein